MSHNLTESSTFTANVSVPDASDARTAASVETPFQALTNRTRYLNDTVLNNFLAAAPQTHVRWIAGSEGKGCDDSANGAGWLPALYAGYHGAMVGVGTARSRCVYNLARVVPVGATITQVRARVKPVGAQASNANRMNLELYISDTSSSSISGGTTYDDGTANLQWLTKSGLTVTFDKADECIQAVIRNQSTFALDLIWGIEVTFSTAKRFLD